jgi:hypothetical protein
VILLLLMNVVCIGVGVGVAALASYPLYWGLLAGWLCPSVVLMLVMLPYIVIDKTHRHRRHPSVVRWREHREVKV